MKLIIFDLNQTLVDFLSVHDEVTRRLFKMFFNKELWCHRFESCTAHSLFLLFSANILGQ